LNFSAESESIKSSMPMTSGTPQGGHPSSGQTRADADTGVREEVAFFGPDGRRAFSCTHLPVTKPIGGLLICSPLHAEFLHNYRKEVLLARSLATSGLAVQRFHYRGSGNSDGGAENVTFESMLGDTLEAVEFLGTHSDVDSLAFLGTRLSALIASAAAKRFDGAPIVLWQPALDPEDYFREVFRAASIRDLKRELKNDVSTGQTDRASAQQLERKGSVDILGYEVYWNLYRSLVGHRFPDELGEHARDVLLLQLDRREGLRDEFSNVRSTLQSQGFSVQAQSIWANEHWWFSGNPSHSASTLRAVVGATANWLNTRFKRG
jgi:alpha/beta superfamily hydrolase